MMLGLEPAVMEELAELTTGERVFIERSAARGMSNGVGGEVIEQRLSGRPSGRRGLRRGRRQSVRAKMGPMRSLCLKRRKKGKTRRNLRAKKTRSMEMR